MSGSMELFTGLRQPEYTGENRCIPCTVLNLAIAVVLTGVIAWGLRPILSPAGAVAVGVAAFASFAAVIALRGYLVPHTPTITKRYFPDRVLRWFDKAPARSGRIPEGLGELDIESELWSMGVIEPCPDVDDLCLAQVFRDRWRDRLTELHETEQGSRTKEIAELLDLDGDHDVRELGSAAAVVLVGNTQVGQWESEAALLADLAADAVLRETTDGWGDRPIAERSRLLNSIRMFMERCPACDAPVGLGQDTVESCCRTMDVVALACDECGSRLFEVEITPEMEAQLAT